MDVKWVGGFSLACAKYLRNGCPHSGVHLSWTQKGLREHSQRAGNHLHLHVS